MHFTILGMFTPFKNKLLTAPIARGRQLWRKLRHGLWRHRIPPARGFSLATAVAYQVPFAIVDVAARPLQSLRARQQLVAALEPGVRPRAIEAPSRLPHR
jgi:hypothetical protein